MMSFSGDVHAGKLIKTGSIVYCLVIMMMMMMMMMMIIMIMVTMMISEGDCDGYRGGGDSDGGGHY